MFFLNCRLHNWKAMAPRLNILCKSWSKKLRYCNEIKMKSANNWEFSSPGCMNCLQHPKVCSVTLLVWSSYELLFCFYAWRYFFGKVVSLPVVSLPNGEIAEWWNRRVVNPPRGDSAVVRAPWWERRVVRSPGIHSEGSLLERCLARTNIPTSPCI